MIIRNTMAMKNVASASRCDLGASRQLLHSYASAASGASGRFGGDDKAASTAGSVRVSLALANSQHHHRNPSFFSHHALPAVVQPLSIAGISRRCFSAAPLHFDTHRVVKRLQEQGRHKWMQ